MKNGKEQIAQTLQLLRERDEVYGGVNIIFSGDFFQLEPIALTGAPVLYNTVP